MYEVIDVVVELEVVDKIAELLEELLDELIATLLEVVLLITAGTDEGVVLRPAGTDSIEELLDTMGLPTTVGTVPEVTVVVCGLPAGTFVDEDEGVLTELDEAALEKEALDNVDEDCAFGVLLAGT